MKRSERSVIWVLEMLSFLREGVSFSMKRILMVESEILQEERFKLAILSFFSER